MRAAIYARYSSDLQNARSIEDQIALCRAHAERLGLSVVATFDDRALSGASTLARLGLARLMEAAREGAFDVVVTESLDRLSRDQEDLAGLHKRLRFARVAIETVQDGAASDVLVGVKGLMGSLFLADLAAKTRRGMAGVVRAGRSAGGAPYGYRAVLGRPGELEIDEARAAVVRRVFKAFADGDTSREIAAALNRDGVASPRGGRWNASTIHGSAARAMGVLRNQLYVGELVWGRQRFEKNPDTGRRVPRVVPREQWMTVDAPRLAIVDRRTWDAVAARLARATRAMGGTQRRPVNLLSGLLRCGVCGSGYAVVGSDKRGRKIGCSRRRESGGCDNGRTLGLAAVETRVLSGLEDVLGEPEMVAEFVREYHRAAAEAASAGREARQAIERDLAGVRRDIKALVDHQTAGLGTRSTTNALLALEAREDELTAALAAEPARPADVVTLRPGLAEDYRRQIADARAAIESIADPKARRDAFEAIRSLIDRIVIKPGEPYKPVTIEIHGQLAGLVTNKPGTRLVGGMVAGARDSRDHQPSFVFAVRSGS